MVARRYVGFIGLLVLAVLLAAAVLPADDSDAAVEEGKFYIGADETTPYLTYAEAVSHTSVGNETIKLLSVSTPFVLNASDLDAALQGFAGGYNVILEVNGSLTVQGIDLSKHLPVLSKIVCSGTGELIADGTSAAGSHLDITCNENTRLTIGVNAGLEIIGDRAVTAPVTVHAVAGKTPELTVYDIAAVDAVLADPFVINGISSSGQGSLNGSTPGMKVDLGTDVSISAQMGTIRTDLCFVSGSSSPSRLVLKNVPEISLSGTFSDLVLESDCAVKSTAPVDLQATHIENPSGGSTPANVDFTQCQIQSFGSLVNLGEMTVRTLPHTSYDSLGSGVSWNQPAITLVATQRMPDGTESEKRLIACNPIISSGGGGAFIEFYTDMISSDKKIIRLDAPASVPQGQYLSCIMVWGKPYPVTGDSAAPEIKALPLYSVAMDENPEPVVLEYKLGSNRSVTVSIIGQGDFIPDVTIPEQSKRVYSVRDGANLIGDIEPAVGHALKTLRIDGIDYSADRSNSERMLMMIEAWKGVMDAGPIFSDCTVELEFAAVKETGFAGDNMFYVIDPFNGFATFGDAVNSRDYDYYRPGYGTTNRYAGDITYTGPDPGVVDRNHQNGLPVNLHVYGGATVTGYDPLEFNLYVMSGNVVYDSDSSVGKLLMNAGTAIDFKQMPREDYYSHFNRLELPGMSPGTVKISGLKTVRLSDLTVPSGIVLDVLNGGSDVPVISLSTVTNDGVIQAYILPIDGSSLNYFGTGKLEYHFTFDNLGTPIEMQADVSSAELQNLGANANKANMSNNSTSDKIILTGYTDAPGRTLKAVNVAGAPVAGFGKEGTTYFVGTGPFDITKKTVMTAVVDGLKVTVNTGAGGTVSVPQENSVTSGSDFTFTISPEAGYVIADLRVDGVRLDPREIASVRVNKSFTLTSVAKDTVVDLVFSQPSAEGYVLSDRYYVGADTEYPYDTYAEAVAALGRESSVTFYSIAGSKDPTVLDRSGLDLAVSSLPSAKSISLVVKGYLKIDGFDHSVHSAVIAEISVDGSGSLALVGDPAASGRIGISLGSGAALDLGAPADITLGYGSDVPSATVCNNSSVRGDLNIAFTNINGGKVLIGSGDMSLSGVSTPAKDKAYIVGTDPALGADVYAVLDVVRPDLAITWVADLDIAGVKLRGSPGSGVVLKNDTQITKSITLTGQYDSVRTVAGANPGGSGTTYQLSSFGDPLSIAAFENAENCMVSLEDGISFTDITNLGTVSCETIDFVTYSGGSTEPVSSVLEYRAMQATPDGSYYDIAFEIKEKSLTSTSVLLSSPGTADRIYLTDPYTPPAGQYIAAISCSDGVYVTDEDPAAGTYIAAIVHDMRTGLEFTYMLGSDRTITFTSSQGGSFAVPGPITVRDRHDFTFETVPEPGYGLSAVKADGIALNAEQMASVWSTGSGTLTATADMTVSAEFVLFHGASADNMYYGLDPNSGYPTFAEAVRASPVNTLTYTGPQPGSFDMGDMQKQGMVLTVYGGMSVTGATRGMPSMSFDVRSGGLSLEGTDYSIDHLVAAAGSSLVLNGVISVSGFTITGTGTLSVSASSPVNLRGALDVPAGVVLDLTNGDAAANVFSPYDVINAGTLRAKAFDYSGTYSGAGDFIYVFGLKNGSSVTEVEAHASAADMAAASGSQFKVPLSNNPTSDRLYLTGYTDAPKTRLVGVSIGGQPVQGMAKDGTSYYIGTGPYDISVRNVLETSIVNTFLITVTAGAGGSVGCPASNEVVEGDGFAFTFVPDNGYQLLGFSVDGAHLGQSQFMTVKGSGEYTFSAVTADHTVNLEFAQPTADGYILSDSYYLGLDKEYPYGTYADAVKNLGQETSVTFYSDGTAQSVTVLNGTGLDDAAAAVTGSPSITLVVDGQLKIEGFVHSRHSTAVSAVNLFAGSHLAVIGDASDSGRLGIALGAGSVLDLGTSADLTVGYDRNAAAASVCNTSSVRGDLNISFTNINGSMINIGDGDMSLSGLTTPVSEFQYSVETDPSLPSGSYAVLKVTVPELSMVWDADTDVSGVILEGQPGSGIILQNNRQNTGYVTLTGSFDKVSAVRGSVPAGSNYLISHVELPLSIARFEVESGCRADLEDAIRFTDIVNLGTIGCDSIDFATYSGGSASPAASVLEYKAMQATPDGSYYDITFRITESSLTSTNVRLSTSENPDRIYLVDFYTPPAGQYISAVSSNGNVYVTEADENGDTYIAATEFDLRSRTEFESILGSDRTITLESTQGGAFDPQGPITVRDRHDFSVSFVPVPGYGLVSLKVDGTPVPQQDMEAVWRSVTAGFTADKDMTLSAEFADIHGLHQDGKYYSISPSTGYATFAEAVRASEYNIITYAGPQPGSFAMEDFRKQGLALIAYGGMSVTGGAQGTQMSFDIRSGTFSYGSETPINSVKLAQGTEAAFTGTVSVASLDAAGAGRIKVTSSDPVELGRLTVAQGTELDLRNGDSPSPVFTPVDVENNGNIDAYAFTYSGSYTSTGTVDYWVMFDIDGSRYDLSVTLTAQQVQDAKTAGFETMLSNGPQDRLYITGYTDAQGSRLTGITYDGVQVSGFGSDSTGYYISGGPYGIGYRNMFIGMVEHNQNVTIVYGEGGAVSPSGTVQVSYGEMLVITVTEDEGFRVRTVTVNGEPLDTASMTPVWNDRKLTVVVESAMEIGFVFGSVEPSGYSEDNKLYGDDPFRPYSSFEELLADSPASATYVGTVPLVMDQDMFDLISVNNVPLTLKGDAVLDGVSGSSAASVVLDGRMLTLRASEVSFGGINIAGGSELSLSSDSRVSFGGTQVHGDSVCFTANNAGQIGLGAFSADGDSVTVYITGGVTFSRLSPDSGTLMFSSYKERPSSMNRGALLDGAVASAVFCPDSQVSDLGGRGGLVFGSDVELRLDAAGREVRTHNLTAKLTGEAGRLVISEDTVLMNGTDLDMPGDLIVEKAAVLTAGSFSRVSSVSIKVGRMYNVGTVSLWGTLMFTEYRAEHPDDPSVVPDEKGFVLTVDADGTPLVLYPAIAGDTTVVPVSTEHGGSDVWFDSVTVPSGMVIGRISLSGEVYDVIRDADRYRASGVTYDLSQKSAMKIQFRDAVHSVSVSVDGSGTVSSHPDSVADKGSLDVRISDDTKDSLKAVYVNGAICAPADFERARNDGLFTISDVIGDVSITFTFSDYVTVSFVSDHNTVRFTQDSFRVREGTQVSVTGDTIVGHVMKEVRVNGEPAPFPVTEHDSHVEISVTADRNLEIAVVTAPISNVYILPYSYDVNIRAGDSMEFGIVAWNYNKDGAIRVKMYDSELVSDSNQEMSYRLLTPETLWGAPYGDQSNPDNVQFMLDLGATKYSAGGEAKLMLYFVIAEDPALSGALGDRVLTQAVMLNIHIEPTMSMVDDHGRFFGFIGEPGDDSVPPVLAAAVTAIGYLALAAAVVHWGVPRLYGYLGRKGLDYYKKAYAKRVVKLLMLAFAVYGVSECVFIASDSFRVLDYTRMASEALYVIIASWIMMITLAEVKREVYSKGLPEGSHAPLLLGAARLAVVFFCIYCVCLCFETDMIYVFTTLGVAATALTMGLRIILTQVLDGLIMMSTRIFKPGDLIRLNGDTSVYRITKVGFISTKMQGWGTTEEYIMPNEAIECGQVVNMTYGSDDYCAVIEVDVDRDSDVRKVKRLISDELMANSRVTAGTTMPAPIIRLDDIRLNSLHIRIEVYVDSAEDHALIAGQIREALYDSFNRNGIGMPFPRLQLDVQEGSE